MDAAPQVADLTAIYTAVIYKWELDGQWYAFRIGERVPMLDQAFPHATGFGFMTASNPGYVPQADLANQNADEALQRRLDTLGLAHRAGFAAPPNRNWRAYNWLIIDPPEPVFDRLGVEFGQTGTLFWRRGEPVRLRMRAAQPTDMPDHPYIDWLGPSATDDTPGIDIGSPGAPVDAMRTSAGDRAASAPIGVSEATGEEARNAVRNEARDTAPEDDSAADLALADVDGPKAFRPRD